MDTAESNVVSQKS